MFAYLRPLFLDDIDDVICKVSLNDDFIFCGHWDTAGEFLSKEPLSLFKVNVWCGSQNNNKVTTGWKYRWQPLGQSCTYNHSLTESGQATHPCDVFLFSSWDFCYCDFLRDGLLFLFDLTSSTCKGEKTKLIFNYYFIARKTQILNMSVVFVGSN